MYIQQEIWNYGQKWDETKIKKKKLVHSEKSSFCCIEFNWNARQSEFQIRMKLHQIAHERKRAPNIILLVVFCSLFSIL